MKSHYFIPSMDIGMGIPLYAAFHIAAPQYYMTIGTTACAVGSKYLCLILSNIREKKC